MLQFFYKIKGSYKRAKYQMNIHQEVQRHPSRIRCVQDHFSIQPSLLPLHPTHQQHMLKTVLLQLESWCWKQLEIWKKWNVYNNNIIIILLQYIKQNNKLQKENARTIKMGAKIRYSKVVTLLVPKTMYFSSEGNNSREKCWTTRIDSLMIQVHSVID